MCTNFHQNPTIFRVAPTSLKIAYSFWPKIIIFKFSESPANFYVMDAIIIGFTWDFGHSVAKMLYIYDFCFILLYCEFQDYKLIFATA